ncbi:MAG: class I SAM-dependent methyltransferase [Candidatus Omnitrophota bacterium]
MKLIDNRCPICGSCEDYTVIYKRNFEIADLNKDIFSARRIPDRVHYQIVRCNKDKLVRSTPVLDGQFVYSLYRESKFTYAEETGNLAATYIGILRPILDKLPKDAKVLEIGCGNGFVLAALCAMGFNDVSGIEPSVDAAAKADEKIRKNILTDILKPDTFKANTFDLIFFFQTFDHLQDPNAFLKICYNITVPGGSIVTVNHDIDSLQAKILKEKSPIIDIAHPFFYGADTIGEIFKKNSFNPVRVYSPLSTVSIRHLVLLAPIPKLLKKRLLDSKPAFLRALLNKSMRTRLGNICLIATKKTA